MILSENGVSILWRLFDEVSWADPDGVLFRGDGLPCVDPGGGPFNGDDLCDFCAGVGGTGTLSMSGSWAALKSPAIMSRLFWLR